MSYDYQSLKRQLFTEDGLDLFTRWRDKALSLLAVSGAFKHLNSMISGDGQLQHACADLMIERGELFEIDRGDVAGQNRVFIAGKKCPPLPEVD